MHPSQGVPVDIEPAPRDADSSCDLSHGKSIDRSTNSIPAPTVGGQPGFGIHGGTVSLAVFPAVLTNVKPWPSELIGPVTPGHRPSDHSVRGPVPPQTLMCVFTCLTLGRGS